MKKSVAMLLAALLVATMTTGCYRKREDGSSTPPGSSMNGSSEPSSLTEMLRDNATLEDVVKGVHKEFGEFGVITMPELLTEQMLIDQYGLDPATDVAEFYGEFSMVNTNSDHLIAIKAKPGRVEVVRKALEKRKADLEAQFEKYDVNGSYQRAKSAQVYTRGDYVFLIGVGLMPEDPDANPEFEKQVGRAREVIDSFFAHL